MSLKHESMCFSLPFSSLIRRPAVGLKHEDGQLRASPCYRLSLIGLRSEENSMRVLLQLFAQGAMLSGDGMGLASRDGRHPTIFGFEALVGLVAGWPKSLYKEN